MTAPTWDLAATLERAADTMEMEFRDWHKCEGCDACRDRAADVATIRAHAAKVRAYCEAVALTQNPGEALVDCWARADKAITHALGNLLAHTREGL